MEGTKELALTICEKMQNEYPKRPIWQTMLEIEDLINKHVKKQLLINDVVFNESDLCDDSCKYYCTKGFTQERECLTGQSEQLPDGYCKWCKQTPCERLNWSHPLEDDDE